MTKLECIKGEGDMVDQIKRAILATQGQDRVIIGISEEGSLGKLLPARSWSFRVTSESSECNHDPRCQWVDIVYHCQDRSVVVAYNNLSSISVGAVIRGLTEEASNEQ